MESRPGERSVDSGDVVERLRQAGRVVRAGYTIPFQMHGSLAASCAVADVQPDRATVWSATQSDYPTRSIVAMVLGLPTDNVRLIYVRGSGCYGLNGADAATVDAVVLSQAVNRPVRLQFTRQDEMMWENFGAACTIQHRAAIGPDSRIAVWDREDWVAALGNRPGYDRPGNIISGMLLGYPPEPFEPSPAKAPKGAFRNQSNAVPAYFAGCIDGTCGGQGTIRSERILTHTVRSPFFTGPLRSPLRLQNTFANECFMDELAAGLKVDPIEFRIRHLRDARTIAVLRAAAKAAGWQRRSSPGPSSSRSGLVTGRGVSCVAYEGGNSYAALIAEVKVDGKTGAIVPTRFVIAIDCGPISNPDGLRNQLEGGILQGMSRSLVEQVKWDHKRITSIDWETYRSLHLSDKMPEIEIILASLPDAPAAGAGETAITITPAAIGNAIFDATGIRVRDLPFTNEHLLRGLAE
jgi:nicotinate dehydrogenase subunit B